MSAAPQVVADERSAFEDKYQLTIVTRGGWDGKRYNNTMVNFAWEGWQARAAPVLLQRRVKDVCPNTVTTGQFSAWETCDQAKYDETVHYRDNGYPHYEVRKLFDHAAPVQLMAVPDDGVEKANFWFDCLHKCAKLLELDEHTPIPSGVVAAVERLIAAPAAQGDAKGLTDEQIIEICERECGWLAGAKDDELIKFARAIAAKAAS